MQFLGPVLKGFQLPLRLWRFPLLVASGNAAWHQSKQLKEARSSRSYIDTLNKPFGEADLAPART